MFIIIYHMFLTVGSEADSGTLNSATVYIFILFNHNKSVNSSVTQQLSSMFGVFQQRIVQQLCGLTGKIMSWLPDDVNIEELLCNSLTKNQTVNEFGEGIKFSHSNGHSLDGLNELAWLDSDSASDGSDIDLDTYFVSQTTEVEDKTRRDLNWLRLEVENYSNSEDTGFSMSLTDLCRTVFEMLKSTQSDSELQNDMFDLLGFDRFELIQRLLENRKKLIDNVTSDAMAQQRISEGRCI